MEVRPTGRGPRGPEVGEQRLPAPHGPLRAGRHDRRAHGEERMAVRVHERPAFPVAPDAEAAGPFEPAARVAAPPASSRSSAAHAARTSASERGAPCRPVHCPRASTTGCGSTIAGAAGPASARNPSMRRPAGGPSGTNVTAWTDARSTGSGPPPARKYPGGAGPEGGARRTSTGRATRRRRPGFTTRNRRQRPRACSISTRTRAPVADSICHTRHAAPDQSQGPWIRSAPRPGPAPPRPSTPRGFAGAAAPASVEAGPVPLGTRPGTYAVRLGAPRSSRATPSPGPAAVAPSPRAGAASSGGGWPRKA